MSVLEEAFKRYTAVLKTIDFDKVEAAIIGGKPIMDFDLDDAKRCVHAALERWLLQDIDNLKVTGLEAKLELTKDPKFKLYMDVNGTMTGHAKEFKEYTGRSFIIDWKTTKGDLGKPWVRRLTLSGQWREYCWAHPGQVGLFMYRGIKRPNSKGEIATRDLNIEPDDFTKDNDRLTLNQITGILAMRNALINGEFPIWPQNWPDACHSFNEDCPYLNDCDFGDQPPWVPPPGKVMSYSRFKSFLRCPERSRRELLDESAGEIDNGSDSTRFGNCVHRGLAEVYSQVFGVPVEGREEVEQEDESVD